MTVVKICGVRTVEAAVTAAENGADVIGMIFAPSPRLIDISTAQEIAKAVVPAHTKRDPAATTDELNKECNMSAPEYFKACSDKLLSYGRPLLCGVFQNQDLDHILSVVRQVPLDLVQLHGTEPVQVARQIPVPVIKVFHVGADFTVDTAGLFDTGYHSVILLDTKVPAAGAQQGGHGVQFDWTVARSLSDRNVPFLMAGGLSPDNVDKAVKVARPWGVDVSSGVETDRAKDPAKIQAFINNAKAA
ncbi:anthranilate synthase / indole-3-glycerol phosphate synthase [Coemansia sp. RSA 1935]|nr:anthranilate synthase / indole-3-glycerol phosphate synthase [Coemansia sp. RSA 637]KAJ2536430.1 anthranilate synthase / indole-3-glycerol phosphate synthase [Coemansia sp. RSA 1935]